MEERKILLLKNARTYSDRGLQKLSGQYTERAEQLDTHIGKLKELLFTITAD